MNEQYKQKIEISLINVSREEVKELENYLESNCYLWREQK